MSTKDDEFLRALRATFKVEAAEHLQAMAAGLLELEKAPGADAQRRLVETVFRAAHSLKGAARAVDFTDIESLCQSLEDVCSPPGSGRRARPSPQALDTAHRALDAVTIARRPRPTASRRAVGPAVATPRRRARAEASPRRCPQPHRRSPATTCRATKPCASPSPSWTRGCWKPRRCSPRS